MYIKEYFDETTKLENELTEARLEYERLIDEYHIARKKCTHDIVFKFQDSQRRLESPDGLHYCPACNLVIQFAEKKQIQESKFKNSRIIELPNLLLRNGKKLHQVMRQEVYDNLEIYYNPKISTKKLSEKMEGVLGSYDFDQLNTPKVLKKEK